MDLTSSKLRPLLRVPTTAHSIPCSGPWRQTNNTDANNFCSGPDEAQPHPKDHRATATRPQQIRRSYKEGMIDATEETADVGPARSVLQFSLRFDPRGNPRDWRSPALKFVFKPGREMCASIRRDCSDTTLTGDEAFLSVSRVWSRKPSHHLDWADGHFVNRAKARLLLDLPGMKRAFRNPKTRIPRNIDRVEFGGVETSFDLIQHKSDRSTGSRLFGSADT